MKIASERGVTFVCPVGPAMSHDLSALDELCETLEEICDGKRAPIIVMDLSAVTELHAAGLGQLVTMYAETISAGGRFALCHVSDKVGDYLALTKLDLVFRSYPTRERVLDTLGDKMEVSS